MTNSGLFAGTSAFYARFRPGYPRAFFDDVIRRFGLDGTARLLDLGCGTGQLTIPLAAHVAEATGVDLEPGMLAEAAQHAPHPSDMSQDRQNLLRPTSKSSHPHVKHHLGLHTSLDIAGADVLM